MQGAGIRWSPAGLVKGIFNLLGKVFISQVLPESIDIFPGTAKVDLRQNVFSSRFSISLFPTRLVNWRANRLIKKVY